MKFRRTLLGLAAVATALATLSGGAMAQAHELANNRVEELQRALDGQKHRVLELKQQQDQLLSLKDSELATAQQRLVDARKAAAAAPAAAPAGRCAGWTVPPQADLPDRDRPSPRAQSA